MAETTAVKKPADYTNSAENLCNPGEVKELLVQYQEKLTALDAAKAKIPVAIANKCKEAEAEVKRLYDEIKQAIETYGSYLDIETGEYAVKYRRMIKTYHVEPFLLHYQKYASAVVEQTINVKALEGLIKGALLSENDLKRQDIGVITEKPQFAFYIR